MRTLTVRVARWSAHHPWRAIGLWVLLVAVGVSLSSAVSTRQLGESGERIGESGRASAMISAAGLDASPTESVVITARSGRLDATAAAGAAADVASAVRGLPGVAHVGTPVTSSDRAAVLVPVTMTGDTDAAADHVDRVLKATSTVQRGHPDLRVQEAGEASLDAGVNDRVSSDLASAESISLPVTFLILLVAFGAVIAAGIPVVLAFTSVLTALGLYAPLSHLVPDSGSVANVVLLIGMAVGVDYSLFYLRREREERRRGATTVDAVELAAATSGHAVVVSGLAVTVAMAGLFITREVVFASLAVGCILVVLVAVLGSLTVLPAVLVKLGRWVDRPRVPLLWRLTRRVGTGAVSGRLLRPVLARPGLAVVVAGGALLALAAPALGMRLHQGTIDTLPQSVPAVAAYQTVQQHFPSEHPAVDVVVRSSASPSALRSALHDVERRARAAGLVADEPGTIRSAHGTAVLTMTTALREGAAGSDAAVQRLRATAVPRGLASLPHVSAAVGGAAAETADYDGRPSRLGWVVAFVLDLTLLVMWRTFRSMTVALLTTVLNLVSVGAAFGVLTAVFQHSWADSLLHYRSSGFVVDWIPVFCFVILVGLSMDYHVFVLSRVREGLRDGLPFERAVEQGVRSTAGVVTSAAVVMISVFAVFGTLSMLEMKQMGVGLSVAILLDATLVRLVLLPAALLLLRRRLSSLGVDSSEPVEKVPAGLSYPLQPVR